jgi:putative transcriptional regulator
MIKYRFNVGDALERAGFNTYKAKTSGLLSQDTLKKIKNEDTNISAKSLNSLCLILDMQPKDIFIYEETQEDLKQKQKIY